LGDPGDLLIPRLKELFKEIDLVYSNTAENLGFSCNGCDGEKCCTVDLIVHTSAEQLLIKRGVVSLDTDLQNQIIARASSIKRAKEANPHSEQYRSAICALNFDGLCALYDHRPMICRLAGIPHKIIRPDGSQITGPGCNIFHEKCADKTPEHIIDRSPFYKRMAQLETEAVKETGHRTTPKTIAEIIWETKG
jgi:Fe-S-cluster containining protein